MNRDKTNKQIINQNKIDQLFKTHFSEQLDKTYIDKMTVGEGYIGYTKANLKFETNDKIITIHPQSINEMRNIKITPNNKFICKIYGNEKILSETEYVPDIHITMYISKKIVLEFSEIPKGVIIEYDAVILSNNERKEVESKIKYRIGPIPVSELVLGSINYVMSMNPNPKNDSLKETNFTPKTIYDDINYYRALCIYSRSKISVRIKENNSAYIEHVDTCQFCYKNITLNFSPLWYVNLPHNDFFLCDECGNTIGEKKGENDIIKCFKFSDWKS
jgi:hypothetical protein